MDDHLFELRRRFVEGLLVGLEPQKLHGYVAGDDEDSMFEEE